jgi:hypothetical protein
VCWEKGERRNNFKETRRGKEDMQQERESLIGRKKGAKTKEKSGTGNARKRKKHTFSVISFYIIFLKFHLL